jgi:hypothetical protein
MPTHTEETDVAEVEDESVQVATEQVDETQTTDTDDAETFPREYVLKLRDENAKYRQRAGQSDDLARRLHLEMVKATGRLADATDLPFDDSHLSDPDSLTAAVDSLLAAKPHLGNRKPSGDIGQGASAVDTGFSLTGLLRGNAR